MRKAVVKCKRLIKSIIFFLRLGNAHLVEGGKYGIKNPQVLLRKAGVIQLTNGYKISFNPTNKYYVLKIVALALSTGISFGKKMGQWDLDQKREVIKTHQGIKFKFSSIDILDETFLFQVHFSSFDLRNRIVITAGALMGDTPLFYAYYGAKVYAFEPDPKAFKLAKENIRLNRKLSKNITIMNYAIGRDGKVAFPIGEIPGGSSLYNTKAKNIINIRSVSISTILKEFNVSTPYLLDLDIKGAEFNVIEDQSLSKFKRIRIEYSPYLTGVRKNSLRYLIHKLRTYGFNKIRIYKHTALRFDLMNHGTIEAEK